MGKSISRPNSAPNSSSPSTPGIIGSGDAAGVYYDQVLTEWDKKKLREEIERNYQSFDDSLLKSSKHK